MSEFRKVGSVKDFPENRTTQVKLVDKEICIANVDGTITAFEDSCTHAAALLSGCNIDGTEVTCPLHGAKFDVQSGEAKSLPATEALTTYKVKVENEEVLVWMP